MTRVPLKRVVPYVLAALVVVMVGWWGLRETGGADASGETTWVSAGAGPDATGDGGSPAASIEGVIEDAGAPAISVTTTSTARVFVQLAGAVVRPGVYEVQSDARVFQVLLLAGGMTDEADRDAVPLAAGVVDGGCIWVPRLGEDPRPSGAPTLPTGAAPPGGTAEPGAEPGSGGVLVNLNTGGVAELDTLPGVGAKTAQRIIDYRDQHGPFRSIEDLDEVSGIGPATVERLRPLCTF
ncbi:MAG: ComEA family DNA-binding protein [Actinobacteria bacterium]|nr:ComEA family DNA-binding protein [Actinomycetota bacterium]